MWRKLLSPWFKRISRARSGTNTGFTELADFPVGQRLPNVTMKRLARCEDFWRVRPNATLGQDDRHSQDVESCCQASYSWPQHGRSDESIELHQSQGVELLFIDNTKVKIAEGQGMCALGFHLVSLFCLHFPLIACPYSSIYSTISTVDHP
jgi:hypothetical protein